jgi:hypothetical protein
MKKQKGNIEIIGLLLLVLVVIIGTSALMRLECKSKWELSGLPVQWGPLKGCLVQVPSGKWLPSETIRELDIKVEQENKK